jgi:excisionase family DNA binding protein
MADPEGTSQGTRSERSLLISDAAVLLGVSRRTVYYRIGDGRLRTIRTRGGSQRVLLSSIEQLLRGEQARRRGWAIVGVERPSDAEPLAL